MKTYLNDIIPRLARHSERLDDIAMLVNKRWVLFEEVENSFSCCLIVLKGE